jgi:hypothetical protein
MTKKLSAFTEVTVQSWIKQISSAEKCVTVLLVNTMVMVCVYLVLQDHYQQQEGTQFLLVWHATLVHIPLGQHAANVLLAHILLGLGKHHALFVQRVSFGMCP